MIERCLSFGGLTFIVCHKSIARNRSKIAGDQPQDEGRAFCVWSVSIHGTTNKSKGHHSHLTCSYADCVQRLPERRRDFIQLGNLQARPNGHMGREGSHQLLHLLGTSPTPKGPKHSASAFLQGTLRSHLLAHTCLYTLEDVAASRRAGVSVSRMHGGGKHAAARHNEQASTLAHSREIPFTFILSIGSHLHLARWICCKTSWKCRL
mmetsp:Transcript_7781/g.21312  ORF Transcript_7781/g.21312 Transcript_7781/m.21312 type:complete len:207 (+) Transcript_7781:303-923(+)